MLLVVASELPSDVASVLNGTGRLWKHVTTADAACDIDAESWDGTVVVADDAATLQLMCTALRRELQTQPVIAALPADMLLQAGDHTAKLFDDFVLLPLRDGELDLRLRRALHDEQSSDEASYGVVALNLATYQASVAGRTLDMTYMEYELLKHFVTLPHRVHTREELLREVWGYEYYGGARTVDVHVRRLRAKLGEEHAQLIQTVRSVGYIFGRRT